MRVLKWMAIAVLLSCGCCGLGFSVCATALTNQDFTLPAGQVIDLGDAEHPVGTTYPVQEYRWQPQWSASTHRVRYLLDSAEAQELEGGFKQYIVKNARRCTELKCAYDYLWQTGEASIDPLADRFLARIQEAGLRQDEAAELIVTFVQKIPYEIPKEQPFEVLPPALVAADARGDCDSKALLALMLLRRAGIPSAMLISMKLQHAAVGIALPGPGVSFTRAGRKYRYTEVTAEGWPIGQMPPEWNKPHLWSVMRVGP